ncbi:MAG: hypothetical protein R6X12_03825 [bacterium]
MKPVLPLLLALMLAAGCGPAPNSGTLRDAFFTQLAALHGINDLQISKNTTAFSFLGDNYTCIVTGTDIAETDDPRYTHIGSVDVEFSFEGEPVPTFDHLRSGNIDPDAIVATWDAEKKRWRFDVIFEPDTD